VRVGNITCNEYTRHKSLHAARIDRHEITRLIGLQRFFEDITVGLVADGKEETVDGNVVTFFVRLALTIYKMSTLYTILTEYWAVSMKKVDEVAEDEGLKESIGKYAIHIGSITEQVYQKEMEVPIEDMKRYLDGILHLYDEGRTKVSIPELFGIVDQAKQKLIEKGT
jgi:hypothetical protein